MKKKPNIQDVRNFLNSQIKKSELKMTIAGNTPATETRSNNVYVMRGFIRGLEYVLAFTKGKLKQLHEHQETVSKASAPIWDKRKKSLLIPGGRRPRRCKVCGKLGHDVRKCSEKRKRGRK